MPTGSSSVKQELAPNGKLRAAINLGNRVLSQTDTATGKPKGITVELAHELASQLDVPVVLITYDAAGKVFDALKRGEWDIAFLAIDPVRAAEIEFTAPYVLVEGKFVVPKISDLKTIDDIDLSGVRIAVARGSAYDLYLSRTIKNATLVRSPTAEASMTMFLTDKLEAAAGVKQPMMEFVKRNPEFWMIERRFMAIEHAMGMPKGRSMGADYLRAFIEQMKASGFVAAALQRSKQYDAVVAPPAT